jgi:hypothetical protein
LSVANAKFHEKINIDTEIATIDELKDIVLKLQDRINALENK